jgi:uncharacterized repeat protein (TIGR01451 family)
MSNSAIAQAKIAMQSRITNRFALISLLIFLLGAALFVVSSSEASSESEKASALNSKQAVATATRSTSPAGKMENHLVGSPSLLSALLEPAPGDPDLVETFAADCSTAKSSFHLGDTVCAKVSGGPPLSLYPRKIAWVDNFNNIQQRVDIASDPQTDLFTIPAAGGLVDYRGVWRVNSISAARSSVRATAFFTVSDPALPAADLSIYNGNDSNGSITAGSNLQHVLWFSNNGPDAATNAVVTDVTPANTTFLSGEVSDPAWNCTFPAANSAGGTTTCTLASLASGASARLVLVFNVNGGTSTNTIISDTANISSDTPDPHDASNTPPPDDPNADPSNNTATSRTPVVAGATGATCTLNCPDNMNATANVTEGGVRGAHVTYDPTTTTGSCGAVTAAPASGSFFPLGTTQVNVTSETGDGACSFTVTVVDSAVNPPTISCPSDKTAIADGNCGATVSLGTPTTTGDNVTVSSLRSDGRPLSDPYPAGVSTVTWTATAHDGAGSESGNASCTQTVNVADVTPPTIIAANQTASANANCQAAVPDFNTIATVSDNCACASSDISQICDSRLDITVTQDVAAGTLLGLGPHTIQLTANDGAGNTTTISVTFTVVDTTPPAFTFVPAAVTAYTGAGATTCDTVVDPGTATASDNCGSVTITRSPAGNTFAVGTTTITWTAKDGANNTSTATQTVTVVDNTPPVVSCPANLTVYLPLNTTATSMAVSYPAATATDNCGGTTLAYSIASGSVFPVGPTPVTVTATDTHGNSASCSFTVTVLYDFTGFFSPVGNTPTLNAVNAGRAIPVKFSLSGNKGLNIFAANNPYTVSFNCATNDPGVDVTETLTAGGSSLSFGGDQYNYTWKTESSWAGTCRQLVVTLNDGSVHVANFKFK